VCWTEGGSGTETAELALAPMLAAARRLPAADAAIRAGGVPGGHGAAPHLGHGTVEIYATFYRQFVENALAFLDGKPIRVLAPPPG
jgi:phosphoglycerate dehydrogenase-like enzyme